MDETVPQELWALLLTAASAVVLLYNAGKAIISAWHAAKAPDHKQDDRIAALEKWKEVVDRKLNNDFEALKSIHGGQRASYQALLALLDHGIDGNNTKQMQDAKEVLQTYLIQR